MAEYDWREHNSAAAKEYDKKVNRKLQLRKKIENMSLGEFTVKELKALMRLFGLAYNDTGALEPVEEHLKLLEKKIVIKKNK